MKKSLVGLAILIACPNLSYSANLIEEGFDNFHLGDRPTGWIFINCNSNTATYTFSGSYGATCPSIKLDGAGDSIITPTFDEPIALTFWTRGQYSTSTSGNLLIEEYYNASWQSLTNVTKIPKSYGGSVVGPVVLNINTSRIRFSWLGTFRAGKGCHQHLAFDDVIITGLVTPPPSVTPTPPVTPSPAPTPTIAPAPVPTVAPTVLPVITPSPIPTATAHPTPPSWDRSSITFESGCSGNCDAIQATVKNVGDGDMAGPTNWELYWILSGNPKDGYLIDNGELGPLPSGQSYVLSYDPSDNPFGVSTGNYMFKAYQRPGHPGQGEAWSEACELLCSLAFLTSGDYNGDGRPELAIYRSSAGLWAIRGLTRLYFGTPGDIPASADYDGDGTTDVAVFRPNSGLWSIRGLSRCYYGRTGDIPVPGDYNGDSVAEIAVFRKSSGVWSIQGLTRFYYGKTGDLPYPADYDGDGTGDIVIYRGGTGLWAVRNITRIYFGGNGDLVVQGDYNGDGYLSPAIFRPASGLWAIRGLTRHYFGIGFDQPVPADYDGDSTDDIGIFRSSSGLWKIRDMSKAYFGASGDIPVTR